MNICKKLLILAAAVLMMPSCGKYSINEDTVIHIEYMGKGFNPEMTWWGDWFDVRVPAKFLFDYMVLSDADLEKYYTDVKGLVDALPGEIAKSIEKSGITLDQYLLRGSGECSWEALEPGKYTFYLIEFNPDGTTTGEVYYLDFTVTDGLAFGIDSYVPVLEEGWMPVYLGRGSAVDDNKQPYYYDRFSATGTSPNMLYFHVFTVPGALTNANDLIQAFAKGGLEGAGGESFVQHYWSYASYMEERYNQKIDLSYVLACGGPHSDTGYLDYELPSNGIYDVYVVEMLLNGHVTGHFGVASVNVTGTPALGAGAPRQAGSAAIFGDFLYNPQTRRCTGGRLRE